MLSVKIYVNKNQESVTFTILPSAREALKKMIPNAHPAININIKYDSKNNFADFYGDLEYYIYPALLGVTNQADLKQLQEILFVDTQTDVVLHKVMP